MADSGGESVSDTSSDKDNTHHPFEVWPPPVLRCDSCLTGYLVSLYDTRGIRERSMSAVSS
jgi:hypothetical protein